MNSKSILSAGTHFLTLLGINAVPAVGVFAGGWAPQTAMVIYLLETLTMIGLSALRVRLLTPTHDDSLVDSPMLPVITTGTATKRGANSGKPEKPRDRRQILEGFLYVSFGFAGVSGVFIAVFIFLILKAPVAVSDITTGMVSILAFQLFELVADLILWRRLSLAQADALLLHSLRRAFVLYFGVFAGLCGAAYSGSWFVVPFIVLKTLMDLGTQVEYFLKRRPVSVGQSSGAAAPDPQ